MAHIEDNKIVILDKKYLKIPERKSKSMLPTIVQQYMVMCASVFPINEYGVKKPKKRPDIDLIEEYELIQLKKSKLSRSNRNWVDNEFKKNFVEIK